MACTLQLYTDKIDAFLQLYMYSRTPETVVLTRCGTDGTDKACSQRCRHFEIIFEKPTSPYQILDPPCRSTVLNRSLNTLYLVCAVTVRKGCVLHFVTPHGTDGSRGGLTGRTRDDLKTGEIVREDHLQTHRP